MRRGSFWFAKAAVPAAMALVAIVVLNAPVLPAGPAAAGGSGAPAICPGAASGQPLAASVSPDRQKGSPGPEALCKLRPECWSNSDCDLRCGTGLGKCVHSNCPVRICVCR